MGENKPEVRVRCHQLLSFHVEGQHESKALAVVHDKIGEGESLLSSCME